MLRSLSIHSISFKKMMTFTLLLFCFAKVQPLMAQQLPYNILFISVDDMNEKATVLGYKNALTPNLNRLAARGMNFPNAYTQYPMCNASRTSIMTGWRPDKTQIYSNSVQPRPLIGNAVKLLPEYFHDAGYRTERYGKIMHGDFESECYWDTASSEKEGSSNKNVDNRTAYTEGSDNPGMATWWIKDIPEPEILNSMIATGLLTSMKKAKSQPVFYGLGLHTHDPFTPTLKYWNMYGDPSVQELLPIDENGTKTNLRGNGSANIQIPATPSNDRGDVPSTAFPNPPQNISSAEWKRLIHAYYAEVTAMDAQLGLVLDEMDRQNLWSNTIVVFWSDHGQHLGEHEGLWLKNTLFQESLRIPFIICVPGKAPGVCNKPVELVDVYPTLTELCGLPLNAGMEGNSFAPLLDNPSFAWKQGAFSQVKRGGSFGRSIRTEKYHFNSWGSKGNELYDITKDSLEYTNLASMPAYASIVQQMKNMLNAGWQGNQPPIYQLYTFYRDADRDGYGNLQDSMKAYSKPTGYVTMGNDCNDNNAAVYPGAAEINDGMDNNCNGLIDESSAKTTVSPSSNVQICPGSSQVLLAQKANAVSYQWLKNGIAISGATEKRYTANSEGNYQAIVTDHQQHRDTSAAVIIVIAEIPMAKIEPLTNNDVCTTGSILLQTNPQQGYEYQWKKDNNAISEATSYTFETVVPGNYKVTVTNNYGCKSTSKAVKVIQTCSNNVTSTAKKVAEETIASKSMQVFPNPSNGFVTVTMPSIVTEAVIKVYDMNGATLVITSQKSEAGSNTFRLNLTQLKTGIYMLEVMSGHAKQTIRLLIQK